MNTIVDYYKLMEQGLINFRRLEFYKNTYIFQETNLRIGDIVRVVDAKDNFNLIKTLDNGDDRVIIELNLNNNNEVVVKLNGDYKYHNPNNLIRIKKGKISGGKIYFGSGQYDAITKDELFFKYRNFVNNYIDKCDKWKDNYNNSESRFNIDDRVKSQLSLVVGIIKGIRHDIAGKFHYMLINDEGLSIGNPLLKYRPTSFSEEELIKI